VPCTAAFSDFQISVEVGELPLSFSICCFSRSAALLRRPRPLLLERLALDLELDQAAVELVHLLGLGVDLHADAEAASSIRSMALSGSWRSVM
jgi:hypothetical protein